MQKVEVDLKKEVGFSGYFVSSSISYYN